MVQITSSIYKRYIDKRSSKFINPSNLVSSRFFKNLGKYPNKKEYRDSIKGFYVDPYKIKFTDKKVKLEKLSNCQNYKKNKKRISKLYTKLRNLRDGHNTKVAEEIVKKCPSTIVIEDLNVKSIKSKTKKTDEGTKRVKKNIRQSL